MKWASLGRSSCSSSGSLLALSLFCALCFFALPSTLTAQSTKSEQLQTSEQPSEGWLLSRVSSELLATLDDLRTKYPQALAESENLRNKVASLSDQLTALSSSSASWEAESKRLTASVSSLTQEFADYKAAVATVHDLDQAAVKLARDQRDDARGRELLVGLGGVAFGAVVVELLHLVGVLR